jgi:hypothetical protein
MPYPDDLDNVAAFKVHPAIGVARLANNDDYYEFFDYQAKREQGRAAELEYMSLQGGKHWMKRQAVQFKIFAYAADGSELGELTAEIIAALGLQATWSATVANRKLNNWSNGSTPVVIATGNAAGAEEVNLEGDNPWRVGKVWLGTLTGAGLFLPPKGGVYRKTAANEIPPHGQHERDNGVLDTTSDGAISVDLGDVGDRPVVPACVIVAPQDHSPDVKAAELGGHNRDFVQSTRELLGIPVDAAANGEGMRMDLAMMDTLNGDYTPGMEICLNQTRALPNPADAFYPRAQGPIGVAEIRPSYDAGHAQHGALTAGLCSAWQTDLNACLNWWTAEYPNVLGFESEPDERALSREKYAEAGPRMDDPELLNAWIDMMGVGRNEQNDPDFLFERERGQNDDTGERPTAPFPLDPPR